MSLQLDGYVLSSVSVVDDDKDAREGLASAVEELGLSPVLENGPIHDLTNFVGGMAGRAQAMLCDYHLKKRNYSADDGDRIVFECYEKMIPAVLCTVKTDWDTTLLHRYRRNIPCLLEPEEINPDSLRSGFTRCVEEFSGRFSPAREPIRALIRIEETVDDEDYFYVVVPGWDPVQNVRLFKDDVPVHLWDQIEPGRRFHTQVNIGAERHEELYFDFLSWEAK